MCLVLELCFMVSCLYTDIKYRFIRVDVCVVSGVFALILNLCQNHSPENILAGIIPGCALLIFSFFSNEKLGYGDCMVVMVLGVILGPQIIIEIMMTSMVLLFIYCVYLIVIRRKSKKTDIPFVPFIFAGNIIYILKIVL